LPVPFASRTIILAEEIYETAALAAIIHLGDCPPPVALR
jgi:hypothetical protein